MTSTSTTVDEYLASLPEWQRSNLQTFRTLIHDVVPTIEEQIKWGVPVFMNGNTILFAMSAFKAHTKYNFILNGALLDDSDHLFNNGFDSKKSRGIDIREGESIDTPQLKSLISSAVTHASN